MEPLNLDELEAKARAAATLVADGTDGLWESEDAVQAMIQVFGDDVDSAKAMAVLAATALALIAEVKRLRAWKEELERALHAEMRASRR